MKAFNFADERLSPLMDSQDVLLQRPMLSKGLTTACNCTSEFLPTFMGSMVSLQPSGINETLAAVFPLTYIVTDIRMR